MDHKEIPRSTVQLQEALSLLVHELSQSLTVINTYVSACIYRLHDQSINHLQLIDIMTDIKKQADLTNDGINQLRTILSSNEYE